MPEAESKGDFLMFRETLAELECLVDIRANTYLCSGRAGTAMDDGFIYMLNLLTELDVNTSESNAIDELERLAGVRSRQYSPTDDHCLVDIRSTSILDEMIDSKINFIKKGSFSRVDSKDGVDPMVALERLAVINIKIYSQDMDGLLEAKIREIVWRPRAKRSVQPDTASGHKLATGSGRSSETQEKSKPKHWEDPKTRANFISSTASRLQDQDDVRDNDDNGSTTDGGELTPTSTIVSKFPDPNGG